MPVESRISPQKIAICSVLLLNLTACGSPPGVGAVVTAPCPAAPLPPPSVSEALPMSADQLQKALNDWLQSQLPQLTSPDAAKPATNGQQE